jgi:peptidoglycan-N-acetylglucosamine deacetylase
VAVLTFDVDAEAPILAAGRRYAERAMVMSHQAYGPLVGVPRILELLDEYAVRATFFVPGVTAERYPAAVESILAGGHEVGHHSHAHRNPAELSELEEREDFERALASLDRFGVRPQGHRAAMWEATWRTPELVAEYGLLYDSSLMDDDRPYALETDAGTIVELPPHWSLDDWEQYAYLPDPAIGTSIEAPSKVLDLWTSELDAMRRYGCLFVLTCHPFLSGRPGRVETLRRVIEHALASGDVELATGAEVAARVLDDPGATARRLRPVEADEAVYPKA